MVNKIVNFSKGSKYYFELGNYYYHRNDLDTALNYYQRAMAVDPANPENRFNVACLLSELGKYQESSSMFQQIVTEFDRSYSESWFWLAMNHGQQQEYKEAYNYLRKYLEADPEGSYSWQAQEILDYMQADLPMLSPTQREEVDNLCAQGIELVNRGKLQQAVEYFTQASAIEPEIVSPRNNLALSWFYLGEMDKAIEITKDVLSRQPENIFANCNLAMFYFVQGDQLALRRQVIELHYLGSDDVEEMLKLGTTYGMLGYDRRALDVFRQLQDTGYSSFELLLLLGITMFNCGDLAEADKYFELANDQHPNNPYAVYQLLCQQPEQGKIPYYLRIPQATLVALLEQPGSEDVEDFRDNADLWPQALWIICHGSQSARGKLMDVILTLDHQPLTLQLVSLVWDRDVEFEVKEEIYAAAVDAGIEPWDSHYWAHYFSGNKIVVLRETLNLLASWGYGLEAAYKVFSLMLNSKGRRIRNVNLWCAALLVMVKGLESVEKMASLWALCPRSVYKIVKELIKPV